MNRKRFLEFLAKCLTDRMRARETEVAKTPSPRLTGLIPLDELILSSMLSVFQNSIHTQEQI